MKEAGILLYNLANAKGEQINKLCNPLGIKVRWVQPEEFGLPLESLSNFSGINNTIPKVLLGGYQNTIENFLGEMFVMVDFSEALLDKFLREYKLKQIEPVFLKAILTPHNKTWSSSMLNKELIRERLEISRNQKKK